MKQCGISVDQWETVAGDRARWWAGIRQGVELFEAKRLAAMGETRCHGREQIDPEEQPTAAAGGCRRRRPLLRLRCLPARLPFASEARRPFAHAQDMSYRPRHPRQRGIPASRSITRPCLTTRPPRLVPTSTGKQLRLVKPTLCGQTPQPYRISV